MADAAGVTAGKRKSSRSRRPPQHLSTTPPTTIASNIGQAKQAKTATQQTRERELNLKAEKAKKAAIPNANGPSAFVYASHKARESGPYTLPFYPSIELDTGKQVTRVPDWLAKSASGDAAIGKEYVGRLIGKARFVVECTQEVAKQLTAAHKVDFTSLSRDHGMPTLMKTWDEDGEFLSREGEHVPVIRLLEAIEQNEATCRFPTNASDLLHHIYALQSPQSSPWKRPMLRALSTISPEPKGLAVTYYVYTSRLLFELIADPAISGMMKGLEPIAHVTPAAQLEQHACQFVSTSPSFQAYDGDNGAGAVAGASPAPYTAASGYAVNGSRARRFRRGLSSRRHGSDGQGRSGGFIAAANSDAGSGSGSSSGFSTDAEMAEAAEQYDFSLAGILKTAESRGYRIVDSQPPDLKVKLFDYQRSSCQWMLDHERDTNGLNDYFWERRDWADGGPPLWYFPLAGEFRLAQPPHVTGGLLCEEMGLGKTMEVLSTILANPRDSGLQGTPANRERLRKRDCHLLDGPRGRVTSRATLVVVPVSLVGQWAEEIRKNVRPGALRVTTLAGSLQANVPLSKIKVTGMKTWMPGMRQMLRCTAPYCAAGETWAEGLPTKGTVVCTLDQASRLNAIQRETGSGVNNNESIGRTGSASANGSENGSENRPRGVGVGVEAEAEEMLRVEFNADEWLVADNDVVLTTYEMLRSKSALFRKVNFHRCVLDECQEIKTATTNIAKMCQQVQATHRWMVSGTPLSSKIDDLHGELNFLQVWPFSLQNDGFWEKKIGEPFALRDRGALELLRSLIKVVMMRHSKSQCYLDGRPLVTIPARTVEWRGVDFAATLEASPNNASGPYGRYVYKYLERLCAAVCGRMERSVNGSEMGRRDFVKLKSLLALMQKASTHASLVPLSQLDTLKRSMQPGRDAHGPGWAVFFNVDSAGGAPYMTCEEARALDASRAQAAQIEALPAEEVLRRLAQRGAGNMGGLNRDVNRHWAVGGEDEMRLRDSLEAMTITDLQNRLEEEGLPVPRSWAILKPNASIEAGSKELVFSGAANDEAVGSASTTTPAAAVNPADCGEDEDWEGEIQTAGDPAAAAATAAGYKGKGKRKAPSSGGRVPDIRKLLKVSDTIRVGADEEDNEATVESVAAASVVLTTKWVARAVHAGRVYRFSMSSRKKPYVDLLVAMDKAKKDTDVHDAGFSAIYKAMAGEAVSCPICMCGVVRPTVTKCAHLFCRECITRELVRVPILPKCPICRRAMKGSEMMELQTLSQEEEAVALDADGSSDASSSLCTFNGQMTDIDSGGGSSDSSVKSVENVHAAAAVEAPISTNEAEQIERALPASLGKVGGGAATGGGGASSNGSPANGAISSGYWTTSAVTSGVASVAPGANISSPSFTSSSLAAMMSPPSSRSVLAGAGFAALSSGGEGAIGGGSLRTTHAEAVTPLPFNPTRSVATTPSTAGTVTSSATTNSATSGSVASGSDDGGSSGSTSVDANVTGDGRSTITPVAANVGARAGSAAESLANGHGPSLVIPRFFFTPTATTAQLTASPSAPYRLTRDHMVPSLGPVFLAQYRMATTSRSSVKLDAMLDDMKSVLEGDISSKFVVFSQYTQVVEQASRLLESWGYKTVCVIGTRSRVERSNAVASFTNDPSVKFILLTTGSAAAGLTLTAASTVYMLDPMWSAADEAQALNRVHRIGQTHTVRCVVFYMRDSVEERMLALRHSKGNFAQFLEDANSVTSAPSEENGSFINMYALPEMKRLFGMVGTDEAALNDGNSNSNSAAGGRSSSGNTPVMGNTSNEEEKEDFLSDNEHYLSQADFAHDMFMLVQNTRDELDASRAAPGGSSLTALDLT